MGGNRVVPSIEREESHGISPASKIQHGLKETDMPTKADLEDEIAKLKAELKNAGGDAGMKAALKEISRLGGRQGAIASDALK